MEQSPEKSIVAYSHHVSPIKTSQNKNQYFDLKLQTNTNVYRTVCFSPDKHANFKTKMESSSPVKITKYQLKRNTQTNEDEILITKRTRIEAASDTETNFDYQPLKSIEEPTTVANVTGRVTFLGPSETINAKGKALKKQEAVFTDASGSIRFVLWEADIDRVISGLCYHIKKTTVREYENKNYLTLTKQTYIEKSQNTIDRKDEHCEFSTNEIHCPPEGVNYIQRYKKCNKCGTKMIPEQTNKVIQCSECRLSQLYSNCKQSTMVSLLFVTNKETTSIQLFQDELEQLFTLYKDQTDVPDELTLDNMDEDQLIEMLLTVEAKIIYNNKKNVLTVSELWA